MEPLIFTLHASLCLNMISILWTVGHFSIEADDVLPMQIDVQTLSP